MTDSNLQPNQTERKFPFRLVTLCRLHSVPFRQKRQSLFGHCQKLECLPGLNMAALDNKQQGGGDDDDYGGTWSAVKNENDPEVCLNISPRNISKDTICPD
uniref:Uncharacterized protein n=1 Tax=Romanomermis culicivorax TaxID=13658 RepID=A0A915IFI7_ROMCU